MQALYPAAVEWMAPLNDQTHTIKKTGPEFNRSTERFHFTFLG